MVVQDYIIKRMPLGLGPSAFFGVAGRHPFAACQLVPEVFCESWSTSDACPLDSLWLVWGDLATQRELGGIQ